MFTLFIRQISFIFVVVFLCGIGVAAQTQQQDIWRIDTHPLAFTEPTAESFALLPFFRWENNVWVPSDAETFFRTQQIDTPLIIFAPGFTSTTEQTTRVGLSLTQTFNPSKKYRIVFWDWFAERNRHGIRQDVLAKIPIVKRASAYLTLFLQTLKPQSKVCLFGFSFGTRIVTNAVQNLDEKTASLKIHLVLSAAAFDWNWLAGGSKYGNVQQYAEKILITYNPNDWALKYYPLLYQNGKRSEALGRTGLIPNLISPEFAERFKSVRIDPQVGKEHRTLAHVHSSGFMKRIDEYFFFE
ncbi:hypothetical protein FACS189454_03430 [Planctomycetales bacterium]|nr:hypothetical protein FACS189454_03430 [Planctomycetales bacterium]